jgi:hypothetical protein
MLVGLGLQGNHINLKAYRSILNPAVLCLLSRAGLVCAIATTKNQHFTLVRQFKIILVVRRQPQAHLCSG